MRFPYLPLLAALIAASCATRVSESPPPEGKPLKPLQRRASAAGSVLRLPELESTPEAIQASLRQAIQAGNAALDAIGRLRPEQTTFENTVRALDDLYYQAGLTANRLGLIKETSEQAALRDAATEAIKEYEAWAVGLEYREDVYRAVKAYEASRPHLTGEHARLLEEIVRDYRRAGLHLPPAERAEVEQLRKTLSKLTTDFDTHIKNARKPVTFTSAELEGLPEDFLKLTRTGENEHTVLANVTWQNQAVMENARREETRRRLLLARYTLAREENVPLLADILRVRNLIAKKLGYDSWADYRIEPKMAKNAATARDFLLRLKEGLEPKFQAEVRAFQALKARDTGNPEARVEIWDLAYYSNQLKKEQFQVDSEALRVFFPYEQTLAGMFRIYEHLFALRIERVAPPARWTGSLELYAVSDSRTGEPLGCFYLDMFPREGKYNHFAQFGLIEGKRLPNGKYQRPTVALICNFPPPEKDRPSLLTHDHVETLFHEFGHALHSILTRAEFARFSGTSVPRDFVEAPSQMLENWVWDKQVLDRFAADYRDPSRKIPEEILSQLKAARLATIGTFYRRQLTFGLIDLALHAGRPAGETVDPVQISNPIFAEVLRPVPPETAFVAYFGHLNGYDGGYYGYAWADAISADMATVFETAPERFFDRQAGLRLREEIYAPGGSRDVNTSIMKFLGRSQSIEPFLKSLGIGAPSSGNTR